MGGYPQPFAEKICLVVFESVPYRFVKVSLQVPSIHFCQFLPQHRRSLQELKLRLTLSKKIHQIFNSAVSVSTIWLGVKESQWSFENFDRTCIFEVERKLVDDVWSLWETQISNEMCIAQPRNNIDSLWTQMKQFCVNFGKFFGHLENIFKATSRKLQDNFWKLWENLCITLR